MSIDIKTTSDVGARVTELGRGASESRVSVRAEPGKAEALVTDDTLTLTATAANLSGVLEALSKAPVVDTERVERIKSALASGEYSIDPERIARKLILIEGDL